MENDETTEQGALRESWEEARAEMTIEGLYCLYSVPDIDQVFFFYRGQLKSENSFGVGEESLEVALFAEEDIPWNNLAFYTVEKTLRYYFEDRKTGNFPDHDDALVRPPHYSKSHIKGT